jgi:hypothetical protein
MEFAQPLVQYLRCVLKEEGISASPDKIKAVRTYPIPKNVRDVRAFLGLASFYRTHGKSRRNIQTSDPA